MNLQTNAAPASGGIASSSVVFCDPDGRIRGSAALDVAGAALSGAAPFQFRRQFEKSGSSAVVVILDDFERLLPADRDLLGLHSLRHFANEIDDEHAVL